jgi:glycosyltransferase involved in cell wall biosynthesis
VPLTSSAAGDDWTLTGDPRANRRSSGRRLAAPAPRYAIDGRYIHDRCPGLARYVYNLVRALAALAPDRELVVVVDPSAPNTRYDMPALAAARNVQLRECRLPILSTAEQRLATTGVLRGTSLYHSPAYSKPLWCGTPSVLTLFDATPFLVRDEVPGRCARLALRVAYALATRTARATITASHASADELRAVIGRRADRLSVIPLGVDPSFAPPSRAARADLRQRTGLPSSYLLYVGSNKPKKNLPALVDAWARVDTRIPLVIAGPGHARYPAARERAAALGLESRVLFRGEVSPADLPVLLGGALAFVFPSLHEGFGLPPLEAMACGVPVACSNRAALPEVCGDAALLFDPGDAQAIADALARMLDDRNLREQLAARGHARAATFTWERTAAATLAVYDAVLGGGGTDSSSR